MAKVRLAPGDVSVPAHLSQRYFTPITEIVIWFAGWLALMRIVQIMVGPPKLVYVFMFVLSVLGPYRTNEGRLWRLPLDEISNGLVQRRHGRLFDQPREKSSPFAETVIDQFILPASSRKSEMTDIGLVNLGNGRFGAVLLIKGSRYAHTGAEQLLELADQVLSTLPSTLDYAFVVAIRDRDPSPLQRFMNEALHPDLVRPSSQVAPVSRKRATFLNRVAREMQALDSGRESTFAVVLTLEGNKGLARAGDTITETALRTSPVIRRAQACARAFKNAGVDASLATHQEAIRYFGTLCSGQPQDGYLPHNVSAPGRECLLVNNVYLGFLKVTAQPSVASATTFGRYWHARNYQGKPILLTVATTATNMSAKKEASALGRMIGLLRIFEQVTMSGTFRTSRAEQRDSSLVEREREIGRAGFRLTDSETRLMVLAASPEELEEHLICVEEAFEARGITLSRTAGAAQMLRALQVITGFNY